MSYEIYLFFLGGGVEVRGERKETICWSLGKKEKVEVDFRSVDSTRKKIQNRPTRNVKFRFKMTPRGVEMGWRGETYTLLHAFPGSFFFF